MTTNPAGPRSGQNRQTAAQLSPDGFNEELTPEAKEAIREVTVWRTTTPDSPLPTDPAEVTDDNPYVPPALIPDGLDDLTPEEIAALYGAGGTPSPVPDEIHQLITGLTNRIGELNNQVADLAKRVKALEDKGGGTTSSAKSATKA